MTIDQPAAGQTPQLRRLWTEAFGDEDAYLDIFFSTAFSPDRCRCVTESGKVVSAIYWFDCGYADQKAAYLYALATDGVHRGRGLARCLMEHVHRHLMNSGYACSILVPGEPGLADYYASMGYRFCGGSREFACTADGEPVPLKKLEASEYALLRRKLLPAGSVIQEGENLRFLAAQADLYAGNGFLLAAHKEEAKLTGIELLGDTSAASGVLKALQCDHGTFRVPSSANPNAMYHLLAQEGLPAPAYFGFDFG